MTSAGFAAELPQEIRSNDGRYRIAIVEGRELRRGIFNQIEFAIVCDDGCGEITVAVSGAMPEHEHGLSYVPKVERCAGNDRHWCVDGLRFHMPGHWELYFDIGSENGMVIQRAQVAFEL